MIHKLAVKTAGYLIMNKVGTVDYEESYIYGIEIMIEKFITYSVLLILALYFKQIIPSLLFVIFFVLLRGYTGGYHANTYAGCFISTLVMYLTCSLVLAPRLLEEEILLFPGLAITIIVILTLAPVNHPNLDMNSKEIKNCKMGTKVVILIETVFILGGIICNVSKIYIVFSLLGMVMCAILLILAKIMKQEVKVHEEKY